jgi:excisionase family DNA binding protein
MVSLDDLADNITAAATLSPEDRSRLMLRCLTVMAALALPATGEAPAIKAEKTADAKPLLSFEQAAERLAYRPSYVYELVRSGQLIAVRFGKYIRVKPSDIDLFVKHHRSPRPIDWTISNMLTNVNGHKHDRGRGQAPARIVGPYSNRPRGAAGGPRNDRQPLGAGLRTHQTARRSPARAVGRAEIGSQANQEELDGEDLET